MARGIMIVESRPASPEEAAAYHDWYDSTHVPEIQHAEGFISARRLEPASGDTFLAVYEIDGDGEAAQAALLWVARSLHTL